MERAVITGLGLGTASLLPKALWLGHFWHRASGRDGAESAGNPKPVPSEESAPAEALFLAKIPHWPLGPPTWVINTCSNRSHGPRDQTSPDHGRDNAGRLGTPHRSLLFAAHSNRGAEPTGQRGAWPALSGPTEESSRPPATQDRKCSPETPDVLTGASVKYQLFSQASVPDVAGIF